MRRTLTTLLFILLTLILPPQAEATPPTRDFTLDNGLRVILTQEAKAPVIYVSVWYRVGAADEVTGKTGLAHMLEHMMFQGTQELPAGEYSKIINNLGGNDNASTSNDYTNYFVLIASPHLEQVLKLEADRMRNLLLRQEEFTEENLVVREERRMRTDNDPVGRFMERFRLMAYGDHPYGKPVVGWMPDLEGQTVADLKAFYQRWYAPNNATLVITGDVNFNQAETLIHQYFDPLIPSTPPPPATWPPLPEGGAQRLELKDPAATMTRWYAAFPTPSLSDANRVDDAHALDVLVTALGAGRSSRLYRELVVKQGLAVGADADYSGLNRHWDLLTVGITPKKATTVARIEEAVFPILKQLAQEPLPERELDKVKNAIIAEYVYSQDSVEKLGWLIGRMVTSGVDWRLMEEYPRRIRAVTAADVQRMAQTYLAPERARVAVLMPGEEKKP